MKVNGFTDGRQNGTAAVGLLLVCQATVQAVYRRDAIARYCEQIRVGVTHGNICLTTIGQGTTVGASVPLRVADIAGRPTADSLK